MKKHRVADVPLACFFYVSQYCSGRKLTVSLQSSSIVIRAEVNRGTPNAQT
ncbi:hypothetical protein HMPREF3190_00714 [Umbribacter vaginalis]|nr:hypothetical protein HMPREF3190_00714 [Coriobacteriales bacterium DNF00809]